MPKESTSLIEKTLEKYIEKIRPPKDARDQLDLSYRYDGRAIELLEIIPRWDDPEIIEQYPYARISHIKSQRLFKLYWFRASGKWELYPLLSESSDLQELLDEVEENSIGGFRS